MHFIHTADSYNSKGHYSPAIIHNGIAYISGQLPLNYKNGETLASGTLEEQTLKALKNLEHVLHLCASDKNKVLKTTIYIADIDHWPAVNEVYKQFFGKHRPARSIIPTRKLHFSSLIEIEAIAISE